MSQGHRRPRLIEKFAVTFTAVIYGKDSCADELLLENANVVQHVFRQVSSDVIDCIGRIRKADIKVVVCIQLVHQSFICNCLLNKDMPDRRSFCSHFNLTQAPLHAIDHIIHSCYLIIKTRTALHVV